MADERIARLTGGVVAIFGAIFLVSRAFRGPRGCGRPQPGCPGPAARARVGRHQPRKARRAPRRHETPARRPGPQDCAARLLGRTPKAWDLLVDAGVPGLRLADLPEGSDPADLSPSQLDTALTLHR